MVRNRLRNPGRGDEPREFDSFILRYGSRSRQVDGDRLLNGSHVMSVSGSSPAASSDLRALYRRSDSNGHWTRSERVASASWATSACGRRELNSQVVFRPQVLSLVTMPFVYDRVRGPGVDPVAPVSRTGCQAAG